jgi:hypothetical protein
VYGDYIFWTDWVLHAVIRANKYTGEDVVWLRKEVPRPMGIIAVANDTNDCEFTETLSTVLCIDDHFTFLQIIKPSAERSAECIFEEYII